MLGGLKKTVSTITNFWAMSNGCGCEKGFLKYIRPPYSKLFYAACCIHDDDYDRGGDKKSRLEADNRLYKNMLRIIASTDYSVWKAFNLTLIALIYYFSIRTFGNSYFNHK